MQQKSFIYNRGGVMIGVGKDLNLLMQHARKRGGVRRVEIRNLGPQAKVAVVYKDGVRGETRFESATEAVEWACKLADDRRSWWSLATVVHYDGTEGGATLRH